MASAEAYLDSSGYLGRDFTPSGEVMDGSPKDGFLQGKLARKMTLDEAMQTLPRLVVGLIRGSYIFHGLAKAGSDRRVFFEVPNKIETRGWMREDDFALCKSLAARFSQDSLNVSRGTVYPSEPDQDLIRRIAAIVEVEYPQRG